MTDQEALRKEAMGDVAKELAHQDERIHNLEEGSTQLSPHTTASKPSKWSRLKNKFAGGKTAAKRLANSASFNILFVIVIVAFVLDIWNLLFGISFWTWQIRFVVWAFVSIAVLFGLLVEGGGLAGSLLLCTWRFAWSFGFYLIPIFINSQILTYAPWISNYGFIEFLIQDTAPLFLLYYGVHYGWVYYFVSGESEHSGFLGSLGRFTYAMVIMFIIAPVILVGLLNLAGALGGVDGIESEGEYSDKFHSYWDKLSNPLGAGGEGDGPKCTFASPIICWNNFLNSTDPTRELNPYQGRVDAETNAKLGVFIERQQATNPLFQFQEENGVLRVISGFNRVEWIGDLASTIFADTMNVTLSCEYEYRNSDRQELNLSYPANPDEVTVFYSGSQKDIQPFSCTIPMEDILETNVTNGQFQTRAKYTFETWGYATLAFMSREELISLRRQNVDPARALQIDSTITAYYTPGPVKMGMFDRLTLPRSVDLSPDAQNSWPSFGVTLDDGWVRGNGEVTNVEHLILQVPEPFELDLSQGCINIEAAPRVLPRGYQGYEYVEKYTWYIFDNFRFRDSQQQRTISCPIKIQDHFTAADALGEDLGPRLFTFVALAKYDYEQTATVSARLLKERLPS